MSSIKDFKPQNANDAPSQEQLNKTQDDYSDLINLFLSKYGELSEDELVGEMLKLIQQKKEEGTYDGEQIKQLANKVKPFLNNEQKQRMDELLTLL